MNKRDYLISIINKNDQEAAEFGRTIAKKLLASLSEEEVLVLCTSCMNYKNPLRWVLPEEANELLASASNLFAYLQDKLHVMGSKKIMLGSDNEVSDCA